MTTCAGPQHRRDLACDRLDVRHVGRTVVTERRRHAQEHEVCDAGCVRRADDELEPSARDAGGDELGQSVLEDRHLALAQPSDAIGVDVGTRHVVAEVGQAGRGRETHVAGTHHCNIHGVAPFSDHGREWSGDRAADSRTRRPAAARSIGPAASSTSSLRIHPCSALHPFGRSRMGSSASRHAPRRSRTLPNRRTPSAGADAFLTFSLARTEGCGRQACNRARLARLCSLPGWHLNRAEQGNGRSTGPGPSA